MEMLCHKDYHSLLQALAKNYPVSGLICADYAAHQLTALLSQSALLAVPDSQCMQQGFPELFAVMQKRRWDRIPEAWKPILQQLAQCACKPQMCSQVMQHYFNSTAASPLMLEC